VCCILAKHISFTGSKGCVPAPDRDHRQGAARMGKRWQAMYEAEQITTYRELVRLHTRLSDEAASYQNEIQILVVLFPEFTQVFADPCLSSALAVRNRLP
jgi:hypothetical protein